MRHRTWSVLGAGALAGAVVVTVPALGTSSPREGLGGPVSIDPPTTPAAARPTGRPTPTAVPPPVRVAPTTGPVVVRPAPPRNVQRPVQRPLPPADDSPYSADSAASADSAD